MKNTISNICVIFMLCVTLFLPATIHAHPHTFVISRLGIEFDEKGLAGFRVLWTFDDMFSSMIAEDYDTNKNGTLENNEIKKIRKETFSYLANSNYFSVITIEGKPFNIKFVQNFSAELSDGILSYKFLIPCHVTATANIKSVTIAQFDPEYYAALFFAEQNPVTVKSSPALDIKTSIYENKKSSYYFNMIHPWEIKASFRKMP